MARARVSTTVDRRVVADALANRRAGEVDASYAAYDDLPIDGPDEWGDLTTFRAAAT